MRSVEQVTYAVAYMTLAASEQGLGACVVGAIANELTKKDEVLSKKVKSALGLNSKQILVDMIALGYEEKPIETQKYRKAFDEVVLFK